jgi:RNA polymerase sigma factor (sigma-70 family)
MNSDATSFFLHSLAEVIEQRDEKKSNGSTADAAESLSAAQLTDEDLLSEVGAGSRAALGLLFRRHARAVFHASIIGCGGFFASPATQPHSWPEKTPPPRTSTTSTSTPPAPSSKSSLAPLVPPSPPPSSNAVAYRILRDEAEADDLRQEVFLYLSERSQQFDAQKGTGSSWIMQVAYHRALDRRRHLDFRQHYGSEEFDEQRIPTTAGQPSPETIDGRAIRKRLKDQLTPIQQETLELHFFERYSLREIAEKSGETVGNVRHHYYRALERLRSHLFSKKRG